MERLINQQHRLPLHAHIPRIAECSQQIFKVPQMVFPAGIGLFLDDFLLVPARPKAVPCMIGPAQTKWEIWFSRFQNFFKGTLQQTLTGKPVMPVTKGFNAMFSCQFGLQLANLWYTQVIKTQICRQLRLIMSRE